MTEYITNIIYNNGSHIIFRFSMYYMTQYFIILI